MRTRRWSCSTGKTRSRNQLATSAQPGKGKLSLQATSSHECLDSLAILYKQVFTKPTTLDS